MKFILSPLLPLLLCSGSLGKNIAKTDVGENHTINEKPIKYEDLPFDVLYLFFDQLDFMDLLHVAETKSKLEYPASRVFGQKYRDCVVYISRPRTTNQTNRSKYDIQNPIFTISDYELALTVLKTFGAFITNLGVQSRNFQVNESRILSVWSLRSQASPTINSKRSKFGNSTSMKL